MQWFYGRNIGSIPTLLNLCNFLKITPNYLFSDLLTFQENLKTYFNQLSEESKNILKEIIIHIDKNYKKNDIS